MKNKNRKTLIASIISIFLILAASFSVSNMQIHAVSDSELNFLEGERPDGQYYTIRDEDGNIIDKTSRFVFVGDEFITRDNLRYKVTRVNGDEAYAKLSGKEELKWNGNKISLKNYFTGIGVRGMYTGSENVPFQGAEANNNAVLIYHTHSDESYLPTSGTESKPASGDVFKVGEVVANTMKEKGVNVIQDKTPHEPKDNNAYKRSRRTVVKHLDEKPVAIFDIHRDGIPDPEFYLEEVSGEKVAQIRLVVGRQNANMQANLDFAKQIKAYLDEKRPGLIHSIFLARGNYNQDIAPRNLILEMGTYTNSLERVQNGARMFADTVPAVLGVTPGTSPGSTPGDWKGIFWVIIALVVGGMAFLVLSTGSLRGAVEKLKQFGSWEWADMRNRMRKKE